MPAGSPVKRGDQALAVRFSGGFKAKHGISYGSNNRPKSSAIRATIRSWPTVLIAPISTARFESGSGPTPATV